MLRDRESASLRRFRFGLLIAAGACVVGWTGDGQGASLRRLTEIPGVETAFPVDQDFGIEPAFVAVGERLFFWALLGPEGGHGNTGLYVTDGTSKGTQVLREFRAPWSSPHGWSTPQELTAFGNRLFFSASDPEHGRELWVSDGTSAGTVPLTDAAPGDDSSWPRDLTVLGERLFFASLGGLWVSDGSAEGTHLFHEARISRWSYFAVQNLTVVGDRIFYTMVDDPEDGTGLWVSDGTVEGTIRVPGVDLGNVSRFVAVGERIFFVKRIPQRAGYALWVSDGTREGTQALVSRRFPDHYWWPDSLTAFTNRLVFSASHPEQGQELWVSDGTSLGTFLLKDIHPGIGSSHPQGFTALSDRLFFSAYEPQHGSELWVSDGTGDGTVLFKDVVLGSSGGGPNNFTRVGDRLFFFVSDPQHGQGLWVSDGSSLGTRSMADILPGNVDSLPSHLTSTRNRLFFTARDGEYGEQLWVLDLDETPSVFRLGECDDDGEVNLADALCSLNWLFFSGNTPGCIAALNVNGDAAVDIADPIALLSLLFDGGLTLGRPDRECFSVVDSELACMIPLASCQ